MSDLFDFRVVGVSDATARVHAHIAHPDQAEVPATKNFALQVVVDAYWNLREGYAKGPPVAAHPRRAELEALVDDVFGQQVTITAAEYQRLEGDAAAMHAAGVTSISWRTIAGQPRHVMTRPPRWAEVRDDAEARVIAVHLEHAVGDEATIVATFADPALLAHLAPALAWASAIYDFTGW